jgi:hypothetical protein
VRNCADLWGRPLEFSAGLSALCGLCSREARFRPCHQSARCTQGCRS